jgi:hypothetical protein
MSAGYYALPFFPTSWCVEGPGDSTETPTRHPKESMEITTLAQQATTYTTRFVIHRLIRLSRRWFTA